MPLESAVRVFAHVVTECNLNDLVCLFRLAVSLGMGNFYTSISLSAEAEIGRRRFELVMSWSRLLWKGHCRLPRSLITSHYSVLMGCGKERVYTSPKASVGAEIGNSE
jgi:hypothetical protein